MQQQVPPMMPSNAMPSFPPANITTEQIQKVSVFVLPHFYCAVNSQINCLNRLFIVSGFISYCLIGFRATQLESISCLDLCDHIIQTLYFGVSDMNLVDAVLGRQTRSYLFGMECLGNIEVHLLVWYDAVKVNYD